MRVRAAVGDPTLRGAARLAARLTAAERRALAALLATWTAGLLVGAMGLDRALAGFVERRLDPPLPTVEELTARLPPGDPRPGWYAAGLALARARARADSAPRPLDPNQADRAEWDRLPGIGPRTAAAILARRASHGPFRGPEDLLAIRGIGPVTLERMAPYLTWPTAPTAAPARRPAAAATGARPDLNVMNEADLARLERVGPSLARRIVHERRRLGGFRTWSDVLAIEGVGPSRLRVLQDATRLADRQAAFPNALTADEGRP